MRGAQYLYRRMSGIYFVRLCVPVQLRSAVGQGEVHRTTGCRDLRLAKIVASALTAEWHGAIHRLKSMDPRKIIAGSVQLLIGEFIPLDAAASGLGTTAVRLADLLTERQCPFFVQAKEWCGWHVDDVDDATEHIMGVAGLEVVISSTSLNQQGHPLLPYSGRLQIRFRQEAVAASHAPTRVCLFLRPPYKRHGLVLDVPGQLIDSTSLQVRTSDVESIRVNLAAVITPAMLSLESPDGRPELAASPTATTAASPGRTFSSLATEYVGRNRHLWKPDHAERIEASCQCFVDLMTDLELSRLDRALLRAFVDKLATLPSHRDKVRQRFGELDASYLRLVELTSEHALPPMTLQARARFIGMISQVLQWGVTETLLPTNPAAKLEAELMSSTLEARTKASDDRAAFDGAELKAIFSAEWFANGQGVKTKKGRYFSYRPYYYWLPLLALHTGARLNELSQLYLDDVRSEDGIAYLDFNLDGPDKRIPGDEEDHRKDSDKSLKTVNAFRRIPIHRSLIELGFLDYVSALRAAGHSRVFPELKFDEVKGYGKAAGSWFNSRFLGITLKIKRDGRKSFHSFRHNFTTALGDKEIPSLVKDELLGHARQGGLAEGRYDKGRSLDDLRRHLDLVSHSLPGTAAFNIKEGIVAISHALDLKAAQR